MLLIHLVAGRKKKTGGIYNRMRVKRKKGGMEAVACVDCVYVVIMCAKANAKPSLFFFLYITVQQPLPEVGANGSSFLSIGPHTEGTIGSLVFLQ